MTSRADRKRAGALAPEDAEHWQRLASTVKPLKPRAKKPATAPPPQAPAATKPKPVARPLPPPAPKMSPTVPPPLPTARTRAIAGLDQRKADRLRQGRLPIDGRLDLHGMTQDAAHLALDRFLNSAAARGDRCVLIITGKGAQKRNDDADIMPARGGVLRAAVPRWLSEPTMRPLIVAVHPAAAQHGGDGALYVLLKRKR
jgi:DNA-nicking Smr family endonuclease